MNQYWRFCRFLVCPFLFVMAHNVSAFSGTLNFSGADTAPQTPVTDGEANSTDINDVIIQIYSASFVGDVNNGNVWKYYSDFAGNGADELDDGITDDSGNGSGLIIIRTQGGKSFHFPVWVYLII